MKIYERIFNRLEELGMTQIELSRRTGIATSTISDWRKKQINPQAEKLVDICNALDMSLMDLLGGRNEEKEAPTRIDYSINEGYILECLSRGEDKVIKSLYRYLGIILNSNNYEHSTSEEKSITIVNDLCGNKVVLINDRRFKGLTKEDWKEVEDYLKGYIGEFYEIAYCSEKIYIASDFPDEYANSESRIALKGPRKVAKANAAQVIPELIQIAVPSDAPWQKNREHKHEKDAKYGWYRYKVRFGIPIYGNDGELERYNIFGAVMLVRHDEDGKKYLYDFTTIKKETSGPLES